MSHCLIAACLTLVAVPPGQWTNTHQNFEIIKRANIKLLEWPRNLDLNPTENVWTFPEKHPV